MSKRLVPLENDEKWNDSAQIMLESIPKALRTEKISVLAKVYITEYLKTFGFDVRFARFLLNAFESSDFGEIRALLAKDFNIGWFSSDYDDETQIKIFKEAFSAKKSEGTPGALKRAVESVFGNCVIKEWFEDDYSDDGAGRPYHYTISVVTDSVTPENVRRLNYLIDVFAPARSVCDRVELLPSEDSPTTLSTVFATGFVEGVIETMSLTAP